MYVYGDTCILMRTDIQYVSMLSGTTVQYTQCTPDVENLGPGQLTSVHTFHANAYNHRCQAYNLFSDEACIKNVIIYRPTVLLYAILFFHSTTLLL